MSKRLDQNLWKDIGSRLRQLRGDKSTTDFLMEHNLSPRIPWNSVEIGSRGFDVQTLIEICNAIDISLDWLVFGKEKKKKSSIDETTMLIGDFQNLDTGGKLTTLKEVKRDLQRARSYNSTPGTSKAVSKKAKGKRVKGGDESG